MDDTEERNEVRLTSSEALRRYRQTLEDQTTTELSDTFRQVLHTRAEVVNQADIQDRVLDLEAIKWEYTTELIQLEKELKEPETHFLPANIIRTINEDRKQEAVVRVLLARYEASRQYTESMNQWPTKHFKHIKATLDEFTRLEMKLQLIHLLIENCQLKIRNRESAMGGIHRDRERDRSKAVHLAYHTSQMLHSKTLLRILQHEQSKLREQLGPDEEEAHAHSKRPRTDDGEGLTAMLDIVEGLHRRVATLELGWEA